jgi:hypothetical protein
MAAENNYFTFTVFIPVDSGNTQSVELYLRVKPENNLQGADGKYIYYTSTQLPRGQWKTFVVDISSVDETCTEFSLMFASNSTTWLRDIAFTNEQPESPKEPEQLLVNGLQYGGVKNESELWLQGNGGTVVAEEVTAADGTTVNAYKVTAGDSWEKLHINPALLKGKTTVTLSILVTQEATGSDSEFAIRIKPNLTEDVLPGVINGYLYFSTDKKDYCKVVIGEWKTITIDISTYEDVCTEFAIYLFAGDSVYVKDIAVS